MAICDGAAGYAPVMACADNLTAGLFGLTIVILVWGFVYFRTRTNAQPRDAVTAANFITFLAAALLRVMGALNDAVLGGVIVLLVGSLVILAFTRRA